MTAKTIPFSHLTKDFSPERKARIAQKTTELRREMELAEVRKAMSLTQKEIAESMNVGQAEISKIEKRTDMLVSTLDKFVMATGGKLEIRAVFSDQVINLKSLTSS